jgi:phenylacetate-CoA ligase
MSSATRQALDHLRGTYVLAPPWVQTTVGRVLARVPPRLLYGPTFRAQQSDIVRSVADAAFVATRQRAELARLMGFAAHTRHYPPLLAATGTVEVPAELARLPVLTKQQVRDDLDSLLARPRSEMDEATTGGTSSMVPLTICLDKGRSVREWAFLTQIWRRAGYRLGDSLGVLGYRGVTHLTRPAHQSWAWDPGTRELRLSPFRLVGSVMDEYLALLDRYRIDFLYGFPSALSILAVHARNVGYRSPHLRGVLLMSESLHPHQRETIAEGFGGLPVLAGYGLSEKVAIAGELPARPGEYEFEPLYGVTELLDEADQTVTEPGSRGRLVGTGFISMGMPLIRYDTGDLATLVEAATSANCWRLRVRDIGSRHCQDYLVTREGALLAFTSLYPHNRVAKECQFVQHKPGVAVMRIVPEPHATRQQLERLTREINEQADGVITVELETVDAVPITRRGKRLPVEQHLDLSSFGLIDPDAQ